MHESSFRHAPAKALQRRPKRSNECVDTMKMSRASRSGIPDHDAGTINGSNDGLAALRVGYQHFRPAFRFLVGVFECLSDVYFRFERKVRTIARNVCGAHVVETTGRKLLHEIDNVTRSIDIHSEDFFAVFLLKRQRSRTM